MDMRSLCRSRDRPLHWPARQHPMTKPAWSRFFAFGRALQHLLLYSFCALRAQKEYRYNAAAGYNTFTNRGKFLLIIDAIEEKEATMPQTPLSAARRLELLEPPAGPVRMVL